MILTGGNYGNYILENDMIISEEQTSEITFNESKEEFYVIDDNGDKWNYRVDVELDLAIFTGMIK